MNSKKTSTLTKNLVSKQIINDSSWYKKRKKVITITGWTAALIGWILISTIQIGKEELYSDVWVSMKEQTLALQSTATGRMFVSEKNTLNTSICNYSLVQLEDRVLKVTAKHCLPWFSNDKNGILLSENLSNSSVIATSPDSPRVLNVSDHIVQEGERIQIEAILDRIEPLPNNQFSYLHFQGPTFRLTHNTFSLLLRDNDFEAIAHRIGGDDVRGISWSPVLGSDGGIVWVVQQTQKTLYGYQIIWSILPVLQDTPQSQ